MVSTIQIGPARIVATIIALLIEIGLPLVLAAIVWRHLRVAWRYFGYGMVIFILFQMLTRLPLVNALQQAMKDDLAASSGLQLAMIVFLSFTAGLFEEIGRYVGYRWLMRKDEKTWAKALMYGLGHGGIESILLVGGTVLVGLINMLILPSVFNTLPEAQRSLVERQMALINAQPSWLPLLGAWERIWSIALHVALSVMVLQVFRRGWSWLIFAIIAHTLANLLSIGLPLLLGLQGVTSMLVTEGVVMVIGIISIWTIWALRNTPAVPATSPAAPPPATPAA